MRLACSHGHVGTLTKQGRFRRWDKSLPKSKEYVKNITTSTTGRSIENIAVLGGGITGLATTFFLSTALPKTQVWLYEASSQLGGWIQTRRVDTRNGQVVFEQGPRTLRPKFPDGWVTVDLIKQLKMEDRVLTTSSNSVAAQNRFIYYPDHLVRMPGRGSTFWQTLTTLLTESVFKNCLYGVGREPFVPQRNLAMEDESIGSFISRRTAPAIASNIASAVFHGIYAGDIYQLSARTLLPVQWHAEQYKASIIGHNIDSLFEGYILLRGHDALLKEKYQFGSDNHPNASNGTGKLANLLQSSVFTFKNGLGELSERLESILTSRPNVHIRKKSKISSLHLTHDDKIHIRQTGVPDRIDEKDFSQVISTLSGKTMNAICHPAGSVESLALTPSVTVMVVNLFYTNPSLLPVHGFGYLLPQSLPFHQNPERALGVVFDSDATIGQDTTPGTKITVMLGGHWWDGWETYPSEDEGATMAKRIVARHLGISEEPQMIHAGLQKDCIPQYTVGHKQRMSGASDLLTAKFKGRLSVVGNHYTGIGVNSCIRWAKDLVDEIVDGKRPTGLEKFVGEEKWVKSPKEKPGRR